MKLSKNGLDFLKKHEGIRGRDHVTGRYMPYDDGYGFMTIGYGHKIESNDNFDNGLTMDAVLKLLIQDISRFEKFINSIIVVPLTQNQFDALVSLVFNIGTNAFKKSTLAKYINNPSYQSRAYPTPRSAWLAWNKSNGRVSRGLKNRRCAEWDLYVS